MEKRSFLKTPSAILIALCIIFASMVSTNAYASAYGDDALLQQKAVSGVVNDENGNPMPGVNILVKGTLLGTLTDVDGKYSINVPSGDAELEFSFIGYTIVVEAVGNRSTINVDMKLDTQVLDEVVVIGYGTVKKSDITGSVGSVTAEKLAETTIQTTQDALQGRVAGVDVFASGSRPGEAANVRIRGNRSFQATNDPLYVIDGIPSAASISDINPYDIVSIEVLKDASATAIYGSRGANGVILVTTKRGEEGSAKVTFNAQVGVQEAANLMEFFDAAGYLEMSREAARAVSKYTSDVPVLEQDLITYVPANGNAQVIQNITNAYSSGTYDPSKLESYDWPHALIGTGTYQNYQLGVSGGNANTKAALSIGYQKDDGIAAEQDYSRYSAKLSLDQNIGKNIKSGISISFAYNLRNNGFNVVHGSGSPLASAYNLDGTYSTFIGNDALMYNNLWNLNGGVVDERRTYRTMASAFFDWEIFDGFRYRLNVGYDYRPYRRGYFSAKTSSTNLGEYASATYSGSQQVSYTIENLLFYDKTFGDHTIGVTLLQSVESSESETYNMQSHDFPSDHFSFYNMSLGVTWDALSTGYSAWQMASFMGRLNYSLKNKYLFTASLRYDGSSMLAEGHKWASFPSFSLAWKMHEEEFMKGLSVLNELKLRGGYGVTGQSGISPYATQATVNKVYYTYSDSPVFGYTLESMPNPNLGWEKTAQWNIGLDWGIMKSRITGTIDFYRQNTSDLLMRRQLSPVTGYTSVMQNIGKTRNTGLEIGLSGTIINKKDFSWTADLMFYTNKEEIVELYGGTEDDTGNSWFIGYPISTYYNYKFDGIWQTGDPDMAQYVANGDNTVMPGVIRRYDKPDENGEIDYKITDSDKVILGSNVPKWTGSLSTTINYKGFDLTAYLYTRQGQMIYSSAYYTTLFGRYNSLAVDYWTPTNASNEWPRPVESQESPYYIATKRYVDGSFTRLKTLTLGYNIPKSITNRLNINSIRISASVNNVYCWTDFLGYDPETTVNIDTPPARSYLLGLDFKF